MDMKSRYTYPLFFLLMAAFLLLASACSQTITTPAASGSSSLTPLQVLQKSADAMKQLKSSHVEIQSTNSLQSSGATGTSTIEGTPVPQNANVSIKGSGDQALPDAAQMHLTVNSDNQTTNLSQVLQGDKVYVQNTQGQWYVMSKSDLAQYVGNPFAGVTVDENSLLGLVQHSNISDHGAENLNGQSLRHISADLDKTALRQLLNENPDLKNALGQQNIDTLLNNTKSFKSTVDTWIDESQFYVHRTQLQVNLVADTSQLGGNAPKSVTTNLNTIVDLSKFNESVTVTPPTNATPTSDPGSVFGIHKA
jgi:LppX_LprAFG lipoprotein